MREREYVTMQGDTWDLIAFRVYSDEKYMVKLIEANPKYRETVFFSAGVRLKIPEINEPVFPELPPWRR